MFCKEENSNSLFQIDHIAGSGDPKSLAAPSMIRSHSVSGDLHGVQPDPVAADILRKETEQETFVNLKITPTGMVLDVPSYSKHLIFAYILSSRIFF